MSETSQIAIYKDEWWPVYTPKDPQGWTVNVEAPADLAARYKAALDAFDEVQDELRKLYEGARG